jgi:hypothetical protein
MKISSGNGCLAPKQLRFQMTATYNRQLTDPAAGPILLVPLTLAARIHPHLHMYIQRFCPVGPRASV